MSASGSPLLRPDEPLTNDDRRGAASADLIHDLGDERYQILLLFCCALRQYERWRVEQDTRTG